MCCSTFPAHVLHNSTHTHKTHTRSALSSRAQHTLQRLRQRLPTQPTVWYKNGYVPTFSNRSGSGTEFYHIFPHYNSPESIVARVLAHRFLRNFVQFKPSLARFPRSERMRNSRTRSITFLWAAATTTWQPAAHGHARMHRRAWCINKLGSLAAAATARFRERSLAGECLRMLRVSGIFSFLATLKSAARRRRRGPLWCSLVGFSRWCLHNHV